MSMWQTPAVVLVLLTWLASPATSLDDMARRETIRRALAPAPKPASKRVYTNDDLPQLVTSPQTAAAPPASAPPATATDPADEKAAAAKTAGAPAAPPAADADAKKDEAWWRNRITTARNAVTSDQLLADALQSRINALTADWINRDDPAQKARLFEQRQQTIAQLDQMKKRLEEGRKAIQDVLDDAKKADVPAGWIR